MADEIRSAVGSQGYRVESQTDFQAVLVKGKRPDHVLHLILTIVTFGSWGFFVWLPLCIFKHVHRLVLTVDLAGDVSRDRSPGESPRSFLLGPVERIRGNLGRLGTSLGGDDAHWRVCPECGSRASGWRRFCPGCGTNLASQSRLPTREEWEAAPQPPTSD
ncbi:MAG: hypothetical protein JST59_11155 [Actinobacteria bacterium]|nr:hypothetical protein [Actinomycetota bacterium]